MIKVERGIPLPAAEKGGAARFPFKLMAVGDSFAVEVPEGWTPAKTRARVAACANAYQKRHPGYKFATREEDGGRRVRCWRVAVMSLLDVVPAPPRVTVHLMSDEEPARAGVRQ